MLVALALAGCSWQLDEDNLLGNPGQDLGPSNRSDGSPVPTGCDDFTNDPLLALPPSWSEASGTWRVIQDGTTRALEQEIATDAAHPDYIAWTGSPDWTDLQVSVHFISSGTRPGECVLARYQSENTHYGLCTDQQDRSPPEWTLIRRGPQGETKLAGGKLSSGITHDLALRVVGNKLTPVVDGIIQAAVTDDQIARGAVGVSSDSNGRFTKVCVDLL
jgi:hypothetical protein